MTTISDLPEDLVGEIFSWVPLTSLSAVRSTCKKWEALSKIHIVGKKAASRSRHQFLEFMVSDSRVFSLRFDVQGIRNEDDELSDPSMKQINIPNTDQVELSQVYHCDGLLLCVAEHNSSLVVWNPYLGQTKWIQLRNKFNRRDIFALGYDNNHNHKILRFLGDGERSRRNQRRDTHVYDFSSDSWRVLDVNPDGDAPFDYIGVSLKGNSYFLGREIFGPRLPLPFDHDPSPNLKYMTLSWVRDEKLAVLNSHSDTFQICDICVSTKIEPNAVSWSTFFTVDMSPVNGFLNGLSTYFPPRSFFIDEEKKVAVFFNNSRTKTYTYRYQMAYIVGDDGYFKSVNIGEFSNSIWNPGKLACSSYVPSLVQLQV
ncbi:PREDICTED: F-box protein At3g49510-like [Camelina sativa]|uniref:F-box protein At3g49510-like n=1 Tax=Camelina sativa TaxID=90675 RepID=A0ABM1RLP3_CAMSA|nr:PREDICTED: F-box protein At3g49510-like [Camelina sativa]